MADPTPEQRAMKMVLDNKFLTLATAADLDVWCTPVAYVVGPGAALHFYSATEAKHVGHILRNPKTAVSIYNSEARGEDVDGLQMSADCTVVDGPDLEEVSEHYFNRLFPDPDERAWWYRPASAFTGNGTWRFFRVKPTAAFVIDADAFSETKIDRRTRVDLAELLKQISAAG